MSETKLQLLFSTRFGTLVIIMNTTTITRDEASMILLGMGNMEKNPVILNKSQVNLHSRIFRAMVLTREVMALPTVAH